MFDGHLSCQYLWPVVFTLLQTVGLQLDCPLLRSLAYGSIFAVDIRFQISDHIFIPH